eukprot:8851484-Pyramimonas_sp.AAC.1
MSRDGGGAKASDGVAKAAGERGEQRRPPMERGSERLDQSRSVPRCPPRLPVPRCLPRLAERAEMPPSLVCSRHRSPSI